MVQIVSKPGFLNVRWDGAEFGPMSLSALTELNKKKPPNVKVEVSEYGSKEWILVEDFLKVRPESIHVVENRRHERVPFLGEVRFNVGGRVTRALCSDLSESGMLLLVEDKQIIDDLVEKKDFHLEVTPKPPSSLSQFAVTALVRRVLPENAGIGVEFIEIEAMTRKMLKKFIFESLVIPE